MLKWYNILLIIELEYQNNNSKHLFNSSSNQNITINSILSNKFSPLKSNSELELISQFIDNNNILEIIPIATINQFGSCYEIIFNIFIQRINNDKILSKLVKLHKINITEKSIKMRKQFEKNSNKIIDVEDEKINIDDNMLLLDKTQDTLYCEWLEYKINESFEILKKCIKKESKHIVNQKEWFKIYSNEFKQSFIKIINCEIELQTFKLVHNETLMMLV